MDTLLLLLEESEPEAVVGLVVRLGAELSGLSFAQNTGLVVVVEGVPPAGVIRGSCSHAVQYGPNAVVDTVTACS